MPIALLDQLSHEPRSLRSLAASAVCLYLLLNAFLVLCLAHPHTAHLQTQADDHLGSICAWVHKTVGSHVPSSRVILPLVAAALLTLLPLPQRTPETCPIRLTGRSPPPLAFT